MGWFWADPVAPTPRISVATALPVNHPAGGKPPVSSQLSASFNIQAKQLQPSCPMQKSAPAPSAVPPVDSGCPYVPPEPSAGDESTDSGLNPLNFMFANLPQTRAPGQKIALPTEREVSSIPRGTDKGEGNWEYPSPQQMYNAMKRKGHEDTPEDAVESMVAVHNFLNEGAWGEIVGWEKEFGGGVMKALREQEGERLEAGRQGAWPRLLRFQGRSKELTPKAQILQMLGKAFPEKYGYAVYSFHWIEVTDSDGRSPPFDRHDWYILRAGGEEVRYVIDYYSGPPEPTGEPVFYLDVRPAIDRPSAILERAIRWGKPVWEKASGASVRRAMEEEKNRRRF